MTPNTSLGEPALLAHHGEGSGMTHSGGKPHNVGDRGQRYEVRATGYPGPGTSVIGWSNDLAGAKKMASAIRKAPGCTRTAILDRQEERLVSTQALRISRHG